uniref:Serine-threonine/tyrosine-protein kinase catalytic domain-containing protein n=1 Tax=Solanum lycopersicum TaxID=4081 RepID=A0A3Q7FY00_SOLLC
NASFCSWFGVNCTPKTQRVVALTLPRNFKAQFPHIWPICPSSVLSISTTTASVVASLMDLVGHLPRLRVIDVENNQDVSQNSTKGEVTQDIGGLTSIVQLHLSSNHFSGLCGMCILEIRACMIKYARGLIPTARNVRHKNLVPVITTCSSDYIRAFVLQFMPNGNLENWLYKEDRHLNLHRRVSVMLDAAMAVEYLHHGHNTPIVHCDLILAVRKSMAHHN